MTPAITKSNSLNSTLALSNTARSNTERANADYLKVKQLILEALAIIRSDDFNRYFDLFTEDAVWMMPSNNEDVHIDKARTFYGFTKNFWFDQEASIDELVISNDVAFVRVSFDGYLRPKKDSSAQPLRSISRHIWILQSQIDSSWKISRDIWNNPK
ncbi:MAG: ketosteroid isomerase-like protein [Flavobacterium sp.]|jgi:ketosteroid isomerase-like protein